MTFTVPTTPQTYTLGFREGAPRRRKQARHVVRVPSKSLIDRLTPPPIPHATLLLSPHNPIYTYTTTPPINKVRVPASQCINLTNLDTAIVTNHRNNGRGNLLP